MFSSGNVCECIRKGRFPEIAAKRLKYWFVRNVEKSRERFGLRGLDNSTYNKVYRKMDTNMRNAGLRAM